MEPSVVPLQDGARLTFLSAADRLRAARTLRKLVRHGSAQWALTGGLAVELHAPGLSVRTLNDIDFVAPDFDSIPTTLGRDFRFSHVHPEDPPGKTILQCVDPETAVRIDVFRACGGTLSRGVPIDLPFASMHIFSPADLTARLARLLLDLANGVSVAAKHARDYLRLDALTDLTAMESSWADHRKPAHPAAFREVRELVRHLISTRPNLLIHPGYSQDVRAICPRCRQVQAFPLADSHTIVALLGYC